MYFKSFIATVIVALTVAPVMADENEEFTSQIFIGNADGSEMKRIVNLPNYQSHGSPHWSRDGKRIAFDAKQKGENFSSAHVIVVNSDGTDVRDLGLGIMPSLSPRGNRVAYTNPSQGDDRGVWIADVEESEWKIQIDNRGWGTDWSPDGTRVAYARGDNLIVYDVIEGTFDSILEDNSTHIAQVFWNFSWSPDSRQIAFAAQKKENERILAVVDARGSKHGLNVVYEGEALHTVTWQPDQKEILISINVPDREKFPRLYNVSIEKPDVPKLLPKQPDDRKMSDPALSADGKRLAVSASARQSQEAK